MAHLAQRPPHRHEPLLVGAALAHRLRKEGGGRRASHAVQQLRDLRKILLHAVRRRLRRCGGGAACRPPRAGGALKRLLRGVAHDPPMTGGREMEGDETSKPSAMLIVCLRVDQQNSSLQCTQEQLDLREAGEQPRRNGYALA